MSSADAPPPGGGPVGAAERHDHRTPAAPCADELPASATPRAPSTEHPDTGHAHGGHSHGSHSHGSHSHGVAADADTRYLLGGLGLLVAFMVVEVVAAGVSGSLVLLADAGHMLTDAGALAGSLWAIRLAARPALGRWTYGLKRAEILSAAINGVTLLVVAVLIAFEGVQRLIHPPEVAGGLVLVVALIGVGVNLAATLVLARADRSSLNVEGAFRHIVTDLYAFVGTAAAGLIVLTTGYRRADAIASLVVVVLMLHAAWGLLRESGKILLEAAPDDVDLEVVRAHLLDLPEVVTVHDLHVWTLTSQLYALSAHIVVDDRCFDNGVGPQLLDRLQRCLGEHFDVGHSTFQLEPAGHLSHEQGAHG